MLLLAATAERLRMNILLILGAALLHRMLLDRRHTTGLHDLWRNINIQFNDRFSTLLTFIAHNDFLLSIKRHLHLAR